MENNNNNISTEDTTTTTNSKSFPANDSDTELYTIPTHSGWFSWDLVHEIERSSLKEFFDGSSPSRTPKIYKDYRDFIITKYREDPSRRLTFTEVRKSLVGDVGFVHKVFVFLEKWGLINFGVSSSNLGVDGEHEGGGKEVRVEEGPPSGLRVVSVSNSGKVVLSTKTSSPSNGNGGDAGDVVESAFKLPPLASYSDVFGDLLRFRGSVCGNCGEECSSGRFESEKQDSSAMCFKCFKNGSSGEANGGDDYKVKDCKDMSDNQGADYWSEAETLLLLESILKHGDDWDLVAQDVQTKNKFDCIARVIQLPFEDPLLSEHMENSNGDKVDDRHSIVGTDNNEQLQPTPVESLKLLKKDTENGELIDEMKQVDEYSENPPPKRRCIASFKEAGGSLMKQAAILYTAVSPNIAAAAAEAALTALRDEIQFEMEGVFEREVCSNTGLFEFCSSTDESKEPGRVVSNEKLETGEQNTESETSEDKSAIASISLAFQIRTAAATALGAAAAHAKQLADQEDREIEHLVATVIETQLKKLQYKLKHFEELELIMEKEYSLIHDIKESIVTERINILEQTLKVGISRWKDSTAVKSFTSSVS